MNGYKTPANKQDILKALAMQSPEQDYQWDGLNEDDKPLNLAELRTAKRGRPIQATRKELISIRLDSHVLAAFRAKGAGWQGQINQILNEWLEAHP